MKTRKTIPFTRFLVLFSLTITTLLLAVTGSILYYKTKHILTEKIGLIHTMKLNQAAADVRKQFENLYESFEGFRHHDSVLGTVRTLSKPDNTGYDQFLLTKTLQTSITNFKIGNPLIGHMIVMTQTQQFSSNLQYMEYFLIGQELPLRLEQDKDQIEFVPPGETYKRFQLDRNRITDRTMLNMLDPLDKSMYFVCRLNGPDGKQLGLLFMLLNENALKTQVPYADAIAILDAEDRVLYRGDEVAESLPAAMLQRLESGSPSETLEGKRYELRSIGFSGMRLLFVEPEPVFGPQQLRTIAWYSICTLVGTALLSYFLSRWIGRKILLPLHGLIRWIRGFERLEDRWAADGKSGSTRITTMRERFFVYFVLTILLPIFLFVSLFYMQSTRMVSQEVQQTYQALFEKSAHRLELFVKQKEMAMTWLAYHTAVTSYVEEPSENARERIDELLFTGTFSSLRDDTVSFYDRSNHLIYSNRYKPSSKLDDGLFEWMLADRKTMYGWLPSTATGSSTISLIMPIADLSRSFEILGFLKTDVNGVFLSSLYAELNGNGSEAYVVDFTGRMISNPELEKVGQMTKLPVPPNELNRYRGPGSAVTYFASPVSGQPWHLVSSFNVSEVRKQALEMIYDDLYLFTIILLLTLICSYFMSQYLVRPLAATYRWVPRLDFGENELFSPEDRYSIDEVEQLRASFNRLLERIGELVEEKLLARDEYRQLELAKRETQLEALQAQIHPHFLHNTLEIVMYMIEEGERENAVHMIGLLSRLFRYAMGKESQLTSLRDEAAYAKTYLRIMSFRYKNKIRCEWKLEEELLDYSVVKMTLQPILENAIRHTLHTGVDPIRITVSLARDGDDLRLRISDNGPALSEEKLAAIRISLEQRDRGKVGLYNVNSRVKLHFGEPYGITIERAEGRGVCVILNLPAFEAPLEEAANM